jgi:Ca2+-binding RTX toxin-like protein
VLKSKRQFLKGIIVPGIPYPTTTNIIQATTYESGTGANDRVYTSNIQNTFVNTGLGDDFATLTTWNINLNLEGGNDVVEIFNLATITGGAGSDYLIFDIAFYVGDAYTRNPSYVWARVMDFTPGSDKIAILNNTGGVTAFSQLVRTQVGSNVEITISADTPKIVLQNVTLASVTAADFIFGDGTGAAVLTGTAGADTLNGTAANETFIGLAGNDIMNGAGGDDIFQVSGTGHGFDTIDGGLGNDTLEATSANTVIGLQGLTGVETISSGGYANCPSSEHLALMAA